MSKVSVCLTHYNRPEKLAATLESLAAQTRAPDEVFMQDDCSPKYKGFLLGIFDSSKNLGNQPGVYVFAHGRDYFSGYGFGQPFQPVRPAGAVWDAKQISSEVLEISVTSGQLNAAERELLLQ